MSASKTFTIRAGDVGSEAYRNEYVELLEHTLAQRNNELTAMTAARDKALEALKEVLADHYERVELYGEAETQPERERVMGIVRSVIVELETSKVREQ